MQKIPILGNLFPKTIAISLSPNASREDTNLAFSLLLSLDQWGEGESIQTIESKVVDYAGAREGFSFDSGRSSLYLTLKAMGIGSGDEVLLQAYTCIAVPNAVVWAGAKPSYVDIDPRTFNMNPVDFQSKINRRTRAVIVQHTFGRPVAMDEICHIAKNHGIYVVEDCAHSLGAKYKSRQAGSFGDAAIFSFGRDKVISSVSGGMAITSDPQIAKELKAYHNELPLPDRKWVFQQLFHPLAFEGILPWYDVLKVGKVALVGFQKLGFLSKAVLQEELNGGMPKYIPTRMPAAVASLAINQLEKLDELNQHRRRLAKIYTDTLSESGLSLPPPDEPNMDSIFLRYTIRHPDPEVLHKTAIDNHIYLGNWYDSVISPRGADLSVVHYRLGTCPEAEKAASNSVNLPTHPRVQPEEAERIAKLVLDTI